MRKSIIHKTLILLITLYCGLVGYSSFANLPEDNTDKEETDKGKEVKSNSSGGTQDPDSKGQVTPPDNGDNDECKCKKTKKNSNDPDPSPVNCLEVTIPFGKGLNEPTVASGEFRINYFNPSPTIFTPQGLFYDHALMTGIISVKTEDLDEGVAREVTIFNKDSNYVTFSFNTGESEGKPIGVFETSSTIMKMTDSNGGPVTDNPIYYEVYGGLNDYMRYSASTHKVVELKTSNGRVLNIEKRGVGLDPVFEQGFILRQLHSQADGLADIVVIDDYGYEIQFYTPENVGTKNATTGLYEPTGTPYKVWKIENPQLDDSKLDKVRITESVNGTDYVQDWEYNEAVKDWELTDGGGLRKATKTIMWNDNETLNYITESTFNGISGTLSFRYAFSKQKFAWGYETLYETVDPDGANLRTDYTYYSDSTETGKYSRRKTELSSDGSWKSYDYDSLGRKSIITESYLDAAFDSVLAQAKAIYYDYTPVDSRDQLALNDSRPRTYEEKTLGVTTKKIYYAYFTENGDNVSIKEECADPSAAYGDASNLRTTTVSYASDAGAALSGRIKSITYPNGRMDTYFYEYGTYTSSPTPASCTFTPATDGEAMRRTITHGTSSSPDGIAYKSTKEVTVTSGHSNNVLSEIYVYTGSGYERIDWIVKVYDSEHHVTNTYYSNGAESSGTWNCCNLESSTDTSGVEYTYSYDLLKRLVSKTKKGYNGTQDITTSYTYDASGRQLSETVTGGSLSLGISTEYDLAGRVTKQTDVSGLETTYAYQDGGRITTVTLPGGFTQITEKYFDGKVKSITGTAVVPKYYTYGINSDGTQWTQVTTGTAVWVKTTTDALGRTVKEERPGYNDTTIVTEYTYNSLGQLSKVSMTGQADTLYVYDELGNQIRSGLDIDGSGSLDLASTDRISDSETVYTLDSTDWWTVSTFKTYATNSDSTATTTGISKSRLTGFSGNVVSESVSIDIHGNQTTSSTSIDRTNKTVTQTTDTPDSSVNSVSTSVNGLQTSVVTSQNLTYLYTYDDLGRQIGVTDPRTGSSSTVYYTSGTGKIGNVYTVNDAAGNTTTYDYDSTTGRKISVTNALSKSTIYTYNDRGQELTVRGDATYPLDYVYDSYGRMTQLKTYRNEDLSTANITTWTYEEATGLLLSKTDANNKSVTYTYDSANRLSTRTWSRTASGGGSLITTYGYDSNTRELTSVDYSDSTVDITYTYNRLGQQLTVTDAVGTRTFAYNTALQPLTETITGLYNKTITRNYEISGVVGRYTGVNIGTEYDVDYGYDTYGRFSTVTNGTDVFTYSYLTNSNLVSSITYPNTIKVENTYESNRDLITQVKNTFNTSTTVSQYDYVNDALGRRTSMGKSGTAFTASDTINYTYNDRNEVTGADAVTDTNYNFGFNYDAIGNRETYSTDESGSTVTSTYTSNNLNQYTAITNPTNVPTYDDDGDMLTNGDWTYTWNSENRMISAINGTTSVEFKYDYNGRRVEKKVTENSTITKHEYFIYNGYKKIETLDALNSNVITKKNVWSGDILLSENDGTLTYYALADANKNISEYLDSSGTIQGHYEYGPFGKIIVSNGTFADDFDYRFSSEVSDSETELVYYNYRYYSPELGRWLNRDPIEEEGGYNLYGMIGNNTINNWDKMGLFSFRWYGDWGGPGWAGGQWVNNGWNDPSSPNYVPGLDKIQPVDDLDECYRDHDKCYENCRKKHKNCPCKCDSCFSDCDYASVSCQLKALLGKNQWNGYLQAIPGAMVLGTQGVARDTWNTTTSVASSTWNTTTSAASSTWNTTTSAASSAWNWATKW